MVDIIKVGDWIIRADEEVVQEALIRLAKSHPDEFSQHIRDIIEERGSV